MFGNILKMLFFYKCFTFPQPFSQLPNKFYNIKFHLTQPNIKIKSFIHNIYIIYSVRDRSGKREIGINEGRRQLDRVGVDRARWVWVCQNGDWVMWVDG